MKIIALEGLDKSGKNTALKAIVEYLENLNYKVMTMSFPQYDAEIGRLIWKWLHGELDVDHQTFELLQAADKQSAQSLINDYRKQGVDYLIIDRYELSRLAYGSRENHNGWVRSLGRYVEKPDITIIFDVDPEVSMSRKGEHGDNDRYESDLKQLEFASKYYKYYYSSGVDKNCYLINANQPIQAEMLDLRVLLTKII